MTYILGLSAYYHDSAATLLKDGNVLAAAQEERFTRIKHDASFPANAVNFCLSRAGIEKEAVELVVFYDKPFLKFERILQNYLEIAPFGFRSFIKAVPLWIKEKLWVKNELKELLNLPDEKILFAYHHESHAASAFFPSPFEEATIVTLDGVGEYATSTIGYGKGNEVKLIKEMDFPHSLGLLYSAFTYFTGFKVNSGEYKLMGLAPYGEPKYVDLIIKELIDIKEDGSFRMNMGYFDFRGGLCMTNRRFEILFGKKPRKPESPLTEEDMDIAASIQKVTEMIMLKIAFYAVKLTGNRNLCLAGGVALNCVGNGKILKEKIIDNIWIQPAAGDAGGALGAAYLAWYRYLKNERKPDHPDSMKGSYLGPSFSAKEIEHFLNSKGAAYKRYPKEELPGLIARLVADHQVVGLFHGAMEFGPRALGARSIIGDPRDPEMQKKMNLKIKFRESFRPFAPSVLEGEQDKYFEMNVASPYMLLVADIKERERLPVEADLKKKRGLEQLEVKRSTLPAITHVDYSARVQTVSKHTNPFYYDVISEFKKLSGYPVIINTSFNIRGEPIVCSPGDAFRCFMRTNMDYLVMEDIVLSKKDQPERIIERINEKEIAFAPD